MTNKKKELRKQISALKIQHKESILQQSAEVLTALEAHPLFKAARTVLLFHSLPDEVFTHRFVEKWCSRKRVLLPVVVGDELELRLFTSPQQLQPGAYGIAEPVGEPFTRYEEIDFVAVPGVAFDATGNRLGRGKGYYDRLLPHLPQAYKAGVCMPYQLVESVPTEELDVRMDCVITSL
ncbi:MAG: 5-formyltetrahydrofolate cyclo-ligase [Bacteroides sp.]|nr:5-formyltetrahydrofolate cyclo-ligase [Bacteroides sp.]